jgi:uncharacterized membrane protein YfcA
MMTDPVFFATAAFAVTFAGISKGGFGSGAAFAAGAILATIIDPGQAIGIMLPLLMLMDVTSLKPYWRKWLPRESWLMVIGALPGVALGAWLYTRVDADVFRFLIGAIALLFVIWQWGRAAGWITTAERSLPDSFGLIAGMTAGFTSFISHAGGPPAAVYLLSKKPTKTEFQASTVIIFWAINLAKAVPYTFLGLFTLETLRLDILLSPFAILGVYIGVKGHNWLPEKWFFALTYTLLVVTGVRLIWIALT